jgi:uncharacterized membrane protein
MLVLRLVHVVAGLLWVGAAVMLVAFVLPAARNSGTGIRYLRQLIWVQRLPLFLNSVLVLTLASGVALYGNLAMLTRGAWVRTPAGLTFGLGALAAIVAAAVATFAAAPAVHRAIELGDRVQAAGANAAPEDLAEMERAQTRYAQTMRVVAGLLLGTAAAMAVARYLN